MLLVLYLVAATAAPVRVVSRLIECWIRSRHHVAMTSEGDRTLLSVIRQLQPGYDLEYQAPDGSRWLISPGPSRRQAAERW
jgi:hypothetical protein